MGLSDLMDAGSEGGTTVYRSRRRRRGRWLLAFVLALVVIVVAAVLVIQRGGVLPVTVMCEVDSTSGVVQLSPDQMSNAGTIAAVATSRNLPERAVTIAIATSMQESHLQNLTTGDRDSLGLFQQRPSQGWGTADQIADPVYSTNKFLDALVKIPGYARLPLTEAAQDVQHSGYPQAYAKHEADATTLAGALTGRDPGALSCQMNDVGSVVPGPVGSDGLQPGAQAVAQQLHREFGGTVGTKAVSPAAGGGSGSSSGNGASPSASAAEQGLTLSATPRGVTDDTQQGWALAQWTVAHATTLHLAKVSYAGKSWDGTQSTKGWQNDPAAPGSSVRITVAAGKGAQAS